MIWTLAGTLTLLEAARDHGLGAFFFSSTCATYGVPARVAPRRAG